MQRFGLEVKMLTFRCRQIIKKIMDAKRPLRIAELAADLQVSARTIKYDLEAIRVWLHNKNTFVVRLESKPHKGVWLDGDESEFSRLACEIAGEEEPSILLNQEERIKYIILKLLVANGYTTIQQLMNKTGVSRNTVVTDLKKVQHYLKYWNITLVGKAHRGMSVKAAEEDLRAALEYVLQSFFGSSDMAYFVQSILRNREIPRRISQVLEKFLLDSTEVNAVYQTVKCIVRQAWDAKIAIPERVILGLFIRICVVMQRVQGKEPLPLRKMDVQEGEENFLYRLLQTECIHLWAALEMEICEEEVEYIWLQLQGGDQGISEITIQGQPLVMTRVTSEIIAGVSKLAAIPFDEDAELFDSLIAHLTDRLAKYRHRVLDPNPLMAEVVRSYGRMFGYVKEVCLKTLSVFKISLSDDDLAYIVLHFQAAFEKRFMSYKYKALVVCGTGRGTARLLKVRLENEIKSLHVVGCCSVLEVDKALETLPVDLVISVLPLDIKQQTVIISALPTAGDIQAIYQALENIGLHHKILDSTPRKSNFLESLAMLRVSISQHDLPFAENMSREVINQGIQIAALVVTEFKQYLTEQAAFGLTVHILLMVNRLAFGAPYEEIDMEGLTESERSANLRQRLIAILAVNYPGIPDSEMSAILRYFS